MWRPLQTLPTTFKLFNPFRLTQDVFRVGKYEEKIKEGFISPEIFIWFFINSDSNLTQAQMFTLKLFPNRTLTQTLT